MDMGLGFQVFGFKGLRLKARAKSVSESRMQILSIYKKSGSCCLWRPYLASLPLRVQGQVVAWRSHAKVAASTKSVTHSSFTSASKADMHV